MSCVIIVRVDNNLYLSLEYNIFADTSEIKIEEFTVRLKNLASRREPILDKDKKMIFRIVLLCLPKFSPEDLSSCVWALGALRCNLKTLLGISDNQNFLHKIESSFPIANRIELLRILSGISNDDFLWGICIDPC